MIQENEVLMFLIGCIVFIFSLVYYKTLSKTPNWIYLFLSYVLLLSAWGLTIAEGFFLAELLDSMEHGLYTLASLLIFIWIWKSIKSSPSQTQD